MKVNVNTLEGNQAEMVEQAMTEMMAQQSTLKAEIITKASVQKLTDLCFLVIEEDWVSFNEDKSYSKKKGIKGMEQVVEVLTVLPPKQGDKTLKFAGSKERVIPDVAVTITMDNYNHHSSLKMKYESTLGYTVWIELPWEVISTLMEKKFIRRISVQKNPYSRAREPERVYGYANESGIVSQAYGSAGALNNFSIFLNNEQVKDLTNV